MERQEVSYFVAQVRFILLQGYDARRQGHLLRMWQGRGGLGGFG